jgi:DNA-binding response OmpR family regulator
MSGRRRQADQVVGLDSVADDYFRCTRKVHEQLERIRMFGEFRRLSVDADRQKVDDAKREAYEKLIRFLETIKRSSAG